MRALCRGFVSTRVTPLPAYVAHDGGNGADGEPDTRGVHVLHQHVLSVVLDALVGVNQSAVRAPSRGGAGVIQAPYYRDQDIGAGREHNSVVRNDCRSGVLISTNL